MNFVFNQDKRKFQLIAFDEASQWYLLKRVDIDTAYTPYVVCKYLEKSPRGEISWCYGHYFVTEESARALFTISVAKTLNTKNKNELFHEIYNDVDYFDKFKAVCMDEREDYKNFTSDQWEKLFNLFMEDDNITGFINHDVLDGLEDKMYDVEDDDFDESEETL